MESIILGIVILIAVVTISLAVYGVSVLFRHVRYTYDYNIFNWVCIFVLFVTWLWLVFGFIKIDDGSFIDYELRQSRINAIENAYMSRRYDHKNPFLGSKEEFYKKYPEILQKIEADYQEAVKKRSKEKMIKKAESKLAWRFYFIVFATIHLLVYVYNAFRTKWYLAIPIQIVQEFVGFVCFLILIRLFMAWWSKRVKEDQERMAKEEERKLIRRLTNDLAKRRFDETFDRIEKI